MVWMHSRASILAAVMALAAARSTTQQQQPSSRAGWPCGARVDPAYFNIAEGTGGHLFLLAPFEIADSAPLMLALGDHPQTIFRLAGSIRPGVHEFKVPIDSTIESVLFSISVQCLQTADVLDPSGVPVSGDGVTDYSSFRAERMVVVKQPRRGTWTVRAGGSGLAGVMVQARSSLALTSVQFAGGPGAEFRATPTAGMENVMRMQVNGPVRGLQALLVNAAFSRQTSVPLSGGEDGATFESRFTPGSEGFRIAITGDDAQGVHFQRVYAPLFIAR